MAVPGKLEKMDLRKVWGPSSASFQKVAEAGHRRILDQALMRPRKRPFLEVLSRIPDVGRDEDFARRRDGDAAGL